MDSKIDYYFNKIIYYLIWSNEIEFTTMWEPLVSYLINDSANKRGIL